MILMTQAGDQSVSELMLYNTKTASSEYYKAGDPFDNGELVFVHPRGGVVRRNQEYWVYPIGMDVDLSLKAADAEDYPELQMAAQRHHLANPPAEPAPKEPAAVINPEMSEDFVGPVAWPEILEAGSAIGADAAKTAGPTSTEPAPVTPPAAQPAQGATSGNKPKRPEKTGGSRGNKNKPAPPGTQGGSEQPPGAGNNTQGKGNRPPPE